MVPENVSIVGAGVMVPQVSSPMGMGAALIETRGGSFDEEDRTAGAEYQCGELLAETGVVGHGVDGPRGAGLVLADDVLGARPCSCELEVVRDKYEGAIGPRRAEFVP